MSTIIGIDLGTTNSEVAVIRDGQPEIIEHEGEKMLPSAVGVDEQGRILVGPAARNQAALAPDRTVLSVKRLMGEDTRIALGQQQYTPQEISAMILRTLKDRAERALGEPVSKAVITIPAYFKEAQRQATVEAGELAGLEVVRILNEPTAAAMTYQPNPEQLQRALVYDLGGGTFDVSIVQLEQGVVEVLASHGDTHLGGDDFDKLLFDHVCDRFRDEHGVDLRMKAVPRSRVMRAVEEARKVLSFHALTRVTAEFVAESEDGTPLHLDLEIERPDFESLIEPLLERTLECVDRALNDAGLRVDQVDQVVLVGGVTRTPRIREVLEEKLNRPVHGEVEPDLCVALGAATQAGLIQGIDVGPVLVDITPHTLGIEAMVDDFGVPQYSIFSAIIPRNTPLPASRTESYWTAYDGQHAAEIRVFQGENADTRHNTLLGEFFLEGLSPDQPAHSRIPVRFDLDLNGMLTVTATEHATGRSKQVTIDNAMNRLRETDHDAARKRIEQAMGASIIGEIDDGQEVTDDEAAVQSPQLRAVLTEAASLIEQARNLRDQLDGDDARDLDAVLNAIEQGRAADDPDAVRKVLPELEDLVFYLQEA